MVMKALWDRSNYIQIGPKTFMAADVASRRGIKAWKSPAAATAPRPAATVSKTATPPRATATRAKTPQRPRDIGEAMLAGMDNTRINALVRAGSLERPRVSRAMQDPNWRAGAWREAERRGLIW